MVVVRVVCLCALLATTILGAVDQWKSERPTVVHQHGVVRNNRRTAKGTREMNSAQGLDPTAELTTTGHKWSPEEYHTLSSLTQSDADAATVVETASKTVETYPALTTDSPLPPPFAITRDRYVRTPYLYAGKIDQNVQMDDTGAVDQRPEFSTNSGNGVTKWSRYYPGGHRQLKKYGPVILESDLAPVDGDGGYAGYDNNVDYSNSGYDAENNNYRHPNGDDGVVGWYSDPTTHSSRPAPVVAQVRRPSPKMTIDLNKFGLLALLKIGLAKLKALSVLKFFAFLAVKLKLLMLFKLFVFAKFFVLKKILKFFLIPLLPNLLTQLMNALMMQPSSMGNMMPMMNGSSRNISISDMVHKRSTNLDSLGMTYVPNLFQFVTQVQSTQCVEKTACRVAISKSPTINTIWVNWILSSFISYIPNKKIKSYISTYKEVSNYRLENVFSKPSTEEWLKWCEERYACEEEITKTNLS